MTGKGRANSQELRVSVVSVTVADGAGRLRKALDLVLNAASRGDLKDKGATNSDGIEKGAERWPDTSALADADGKADGGEGR